MGKAEWGVDPEFFGPRHAHRERRITRQLRRLVPAPGIHLECAAGVGSLSFALAGSGHTVISADLSLRSMRVLATRAADAGVAARVLPVVADVTNLPFADGTFISATTAETLEHIPDQEVAVAEFGRVLGPAGWLVGTVPAGPDQWSDWDDWAGHLRRYSRSDLERLFDAVGMEAMVVAWGWPLLRLYDDWFLKRVNRRRLHHQGTVEGDRGLSTISALGRTRWLVATIRTAFDFDRLFDGVPWGVGLLFAARRR